MQLSTSVQTATVRIPVKTLDPAPREAKRSQGRQVGAVVLLSLVLCSLADHAVAHWLGLSHTSPWSTAEAAYRRIGPQRGPQVLCAGSSMLVSGLAWPDVAESLGQGIETWTVAGSSPEVWEVFQKQTRVSNTTIIGISIYDLNEMRLAPERASFVPLSVTIKDLWSSRAAPDLRQRILAQYAMSYVQVPFPTAGEADKVLVALRSKAANLFGKQASLQEHEGVVVERKGVLDVEDAAMSVSDWPTGHLLRRLDALRDENHGKQEFVDGPKHLAFRRLLLRAQQQGRLIVVILPISQAYIDTFLDAKTVAAFEKALSEDIAMAPNATLVRLDQVPGISNNKYFFDLVHLNSSGRKLVTPVFLKEVKEDTIKRKSFSSSALTLNSQGTSEDRTLK